MATVRRGPQLKKWEKKGRTPAAHGKHSKPTFGKKYKGKKNADGTVTAPTLPIEKPKSVSSAQSRTTKKDFALTKTNYKGKKPPRPVFVKTPKLPSTLPAGQERLERAIAHMGLASRREAKELITKGDVKVNGKVIREPGYGIKFGTDTIDVKGEALAGKETVLVYKPRGLETNKTSASDTSGQTTKDLHDYFPKLRHLAPIGRLDKDSEGLIIMSNDGSLARALTKEDSHVGKTYLVTVRENVTDEALKKMATGIMLDKIKTKPAVLKRMSRTSFSIVLHEGRKHQIRRMCDVCHLNVEELLRTTIGHLSIGSMKPGGMRNLIEDDLEKLKSM